MKVVDIHPEELIDKLAEGSLTLAERERLDAHLGQCSSCRFEITVRSDLAPDSPAFEDRPQLTFSGGERRERAAGTLPDQPAPQVMRSVRPRSRHRWPLAMLAAALVLCAGGAMAAVITRAVGGQWLRWSPEAKPAVSGARISEAKPTLKPKRVVTEPSSTRTPAVEPTADTGVPVPVPVAVAVAPTATASAARSALVVAPAPSEISRALPRAEPPGRRARAEAVLAARESARSGVAAAPAATSAAEASATRADPAAALFADANRARRDGNLDRAVGLYRTLQSRYPNSSESELSRALLAQLLLDRGNPEAALAGFDRYLVDDSPALGAEALVGRARALEQLGKSRQAAAAWRQVQSRFPGSVHARLAATRLAALGMR